MSRRCSRASAARRGSRGVEGSEQKLAARLLLAACLALALSACAVDPSQPDAPAPELAGAAPVEDVLSPQAVRSFEQALAQLNAGEVDAAQQALQQLAAEYPAYSGPLVNLGILHARAGHLEQAEQSLRAALMRNDANAPAYNQLGIVYRRLGRFEEAKEAYGQAVQIDPQYALAWLNLGVLCDLYLQQPQRALEAYERYVSLVAEPEANVKQWIAELRRRLSAADPQAARTRP